MRILFNRFGGTYPRISTEKLPEQAAQIAENTDLHTGNIAPFRQLGAAIPLTSHLQLIQTAYMWRVNSSEYWFRFLDQVEIARSPIADDEHKRVYWTGDSRDQTDSIDPTKRESYPQMSYTPIAYTGGTDYPENSYRLGVPRPSMPVTVQVTGSTTQPELAEVRRYVRTYVSEIGEEGAPSKEPSDKVTVAPGQSVNITGLGLNSGDGDARNITHQRIYRTNAGTAGAAWQFVAELDISETTYLDQKNGEDLEEVMPSMEWDAPPAGLRGLRLMANGVMIGFRGNEIFFSEPYLPHAWPRGYALTVDYPIVAIGSFSDTIVVATEGRPFVINGTHPESMSQLELDLNEPCVSMRSMACMGHGVVYASCNGLVYVNGSGAQLISSGLVTRDEWAAFQPETLRAAEYRQQYIAFFGSSSNNGGGFFVNPLAPDGGIINLNIKARGLHRDPLNENLYLLDWSKNIRQFEGGNDRMMAKWRSRVVEMDAPISFRVMRIDVQEAADTTVKLYADGVLHSSTAITHSEPVALPRKGRARRWELEVQTTGVVRSMSIAESTSEV